MSSREFLRHSHDALLIDHQAVGVAEQLLGVGVDELHRLSPVLAVGVVVVHVRRHRAGPIEGDQGGDIVERVWGERADQARIGEDSSWNTPMVSPRLSSSKVG